VQIPISAPTQPDVTGGRIVLLVVANPKTGLCIMALKKRRKRRF
jgi:hypothetical protein